MNVKFSNMPKNHNKSFLDFRNNFYAYNKNVPKI